MGRALRWGMKPTVAELEAKRTQLIQREQERMQWADSDGEAHLGLSAWAHKMNLGKLDAELDLARKGWVSEFPAIEKPGGVKVRAKLIRTEYMGRGRWSWLIESGQGLPRFVTDGPRALKKAGLVRVTETKPAKVTLHSEGTGLSGCASTMVLVVEDTE